MLLGIDFGTTRTIVAAADRGNYPLISFESPSGDMRQWYPSLVAARNREIRFALDAEPLRERDGWHFLRSVKRLLADAGPRTPISIGPESEPALPLLTAYLAGLARDLRRRSNLELAEDEPLEAFVAVPATANSNQRFLTLEAFREAGFNVLGMISEPSAAGVEYAHRYGPKTDRGRKEFLVLYDMGGGTFDASVIAIKSRAHEVLTDEGIARLGGDDFDEILLELALSKLDVAAPSQAARYRLLERCREQKEQIHPNTRNIHLDLNVGELDLGEARVTTDEFYLRCQPLVQRTIASVQSAILRTVGIPENSDKVAAVYLVGGSIELPIVQRMLRERYGRLVRKSPYPFGATAIGLAIAADAEAGYSLRERFTRHFGVWREDDNGARIVFDPIFHKDTPLPKASQAPLTHVRHYRPAHNVGHFRYLECSRLLPDGRPDGDITPWEEIYFPFDPRLREQALNDGLVRRNGDCARQRIEERYTCDSQGIIQVAIVNRSDGYQRKYRLRN